MKLLLEGSASKQLCLHAIPTLSGLILCEHVYLVLHVCMCATLKLRKEGRTFMWTVSIYKLNKWLLNVYEKICVNCKKNMRQRRILWMLISAVTMKKIMRECVPSELFWVVGVFQSPAEKDITQLTNSMESNLSHKRVHTRAPVSHAHSR